MNKRAILRLREYESGRIENVLNDEPMCFEAASKLNFVVWGDPQVSKKLPKRDNVFIKAIADIKENVQGKLDALVVCGDVAEWGSSDDFGFVGDLLEYTSDKCSNFFLIPGNHDVRLRPWKSQVRTFMKAFSFGSEIPTDRYWFSRDINGYRFIMLGTDRATFEESYLSGKQLEWLENELKEATEDGKPVFVFAHQPLKHTNGLPNTWLGKGKWRGSIGRQSDKLRAILEKFPNVFFICGHLHWCTNKYSVEQYDNLVTIAAPTIDAGTHGEFNVNGQGLILSVFDDRVLIKSRVFAEGRYVPDNVPCSEVTIELK